MIKKKFSRRTFLKVSAVGTVAVAGTGAADQVKAAVNKAHKVRYGMVIDLRKCFGCHACSIACKAEYDVPLARWRSWVQVSERGKYPYVQRQFLPLLCNHCEHPPCIAVCPTKATHKRADGIVMQEDDKCIGCKACIQACPYKARFVNPRTHTANKCDFCVHRLSQGLLPACVNTCNSRARIFGDLNDPESAVSKVMRENKIHALRRNLGTEPSVFYIGLDQHSYDPEKACIICDLPEGVQS